LCSVTLIPEVQEREKGEGNGYQDSAVCG